MRDKLEAGDVQELRVLIELIEPTQPLIKEETISTNVLVRVTAGVKCIANKLERIILQKTQAKEECQQRKILVTSCFNCPYASHKGALGKVAYVPLCSLANKELPHNVVDENHVIYAEPIGVIPSWCPLTED